MLVQLFRRRRHHECRICCVRLPDDSCTPKVPHWQVHRDLPDDLGWYSHVHHCCSELRWTYGSEVSARRYRILHRASLDAVDWHVLDEKRTTVSNELVARVRWDSCAAWCWNFVGFGTHNWVNCSLEVDLSRKSVWDKR